MRDEYGWVEELIDYNPEYSVIICEAARCIKKGKHVLDKVCKVGGKEVIVTRKITLDDFIEDFCSLDGVNNIIVRKIRERYR